MIETLRLDGHLYDLQKLNSDRRTSELIRAELLSQFYFLIGLVTNNSRTDTNISNDMMMTLIFFIRSSLISKPTMFETHSPALPSSTSMSAKLKQTQQKDADKQVEDDLLRFFHRESALRYSIVGNWLKFVARKHFDDDLIEMIERIKIFSSSQDVRFY